MVIVRDMTIDSLKNQGGFLKNEKYIKFINYLNYYKLISNKYTYFIFKFYKKIK